MAGQVAPRVICELFLVLKADGSLKQRVGFSEEREAKTFVEDVYGAANIGPRAEIRRVVCIDAEEWERMKRQ